MSKSPSLNYCEETISLVHNIEEAFIALGERLYKIRSEQLWQSNWDSYDEYLMELKISQAKASKLVSIYEKFVMEYGIEQEKLSKVSWSTLYTMLPLVTDKKSAKEWVEKGELMKRDDIEDEVREFKRGSVCEHKNLEDLHIQVCLDCSKRFRKYDN